MLLIGMQKGFATPKLYAEDGQVQIILIGVLVVAVAVAGAFYLGKSTTPKPSPASVVSYQTPQPTLPPKSDASPKPSGAGASGVPNGTAETANWKTYTNTKYGYSLKYPPGTILEEKPGDVVFIDKQIYVAVTNSDPEQCRGDCPLIQKSEEVTIKGVNSKKLTGYIGAVGGSVPQSYQTIVIPHNNKFYTFTVYELKYDENQPPTREIGSVPEAKVNLLDQILSTFRFTQ